MKKLSLSEQFIYIYNELDSFMRKELKARDEVEHGFLLSEMVKNGNKMFEIHGYELRLFARLRNAIIHNPYRKTAHPIAEPHEEIVEQYERIKNEVINPPKALSIAVPGASIFVASLDSKVQDILQVMIDKSYTHIPVIEDNKMIGIFSENTLFCYLVDNKDCILTSDITVRDFKEYIPLNKHMSEYFEFISRNTTLSDVEEIFSKGLKDTKRIGVVYITEHGRQDEKLLGMITVWDLAGNITRR